MRKKPKPTDHDGEWKNAEAPAHSQSSGLTPWRFSEPVRQFLCPPAAPDNGLTLVSLLESWAAKCRNLRDSHYVTARRLQRLHYIVGFPSVALSTIVGTAVFASVGESGAAPRVFVGATSVLAAVFTGILTFMRPAERAQEHRKCAANFESVVREIQTACIGGSPSMDVVERIHLRLDELGFGDALPELR